MSKAKPKAAQTKTAKARPDAVWTCAWCGEEVEELVLIDNPGPNAKWICKPCNYRGRKP